MEKAPLKEIGYRIYQRRTAKHYTTKEMAGPLHLTPQEYVKIEKGKRMISLEEMLTLCNLLQFSPEYFLTGQMGIVEYSDLLRHVQSMDENFRNNVLHLIDNWNSSKE